MKMGLGGSLGSLQEPRPLKTIQGAPAKMKMEV